MGKAAALAGFGDHLPDALGEDARAQRQVAGSQALGGGDDVRLHAEHVLGGEERAEAAEGGHHLVGDVEHVVLPAHLPHALVVAARRDDHATGAHDRLGEEGRDLVGAQFEDLLLEFGDQEFEEVRLGHAFRRAIGVRAGDVVDEVLEEVELRRVVGDLAAEGHGEEGRAVVGVDPADDVLLGVLAAAVLVVLDQPVGGVHGGGAAGGEEHVVEVARRQFGELLAELDGADVGHVAERVGVGQLAHLLGDGVGHFRAAQADVGAPHAAHRVEVAPAVGIVDIGAFTRGDVQRAVLAVVVEHVVAVHVVRLVGGDQLLVVELGEEGWGWGVHTGCLCISDVLFGGRHPRPGPLPEEEGATVPAMDYRSDSSRQAIPLSPWERAGVRGSGVVTCPSSPHSTSA
ncbi:hypothetical protein D3C76_925330 [compost metagenome]